MSEHLPIWHFHANSRGAVNGSDGARFRNAAWRNVMRSTLQETTVVNDRLAEVFDLSEREQQLLQRVERQVAGREQPSRAREVADYLNQRYGHETYTPVEHLSSANASAFVQAFNTAGVATTNMFSQKQRRELDALPFFLTRSEAALVSPEVRAEYMRWVSSGEGVYADGQPLHVARQRRDWIIDCLRRGLVNRQLTVVEVLEFVDNKALGDYLVKALKIYSSPGQYVYPHTPTITYSLDQTMADPFCDEYAVLHEMANRIANNAV